MFDIVKKKDRVILNFAKELGYDTIYTLEDFNILFGNSKVRCAVENKKVEILLDPHLGVKNDHLHFREGGLNQVICKLAAKNQVTIGFSYGAMKKEKDLGRIMQNIKLCKKYGVKILFVSLAESKFEMRAAHDIFSLLKILGGEKNMLLTKKVKK